MRLLHCFLTFAHDKDLPMDDKDIERRVIRRKRRQRSQILAYLTLILLIAMLAVLGYFGSMRAIALFKDYDTKVAQALEDAAKEAQIADGESESPVEEEPPTESEVSVDVQEEKTTDALDALVDTLISDMTLEEKVAGLFVVSPESITGVGTAIQAGNSTKEALESNPIGGLIYAEKNYKSAEQFTTMIANSMAYSKYPLFIAVSREIGSSTSFGLTSTDGASDLTDSSSAGVTYSIIAKGLLELGVNMNLAPLADIVAEDGNSSLQGRTFGSDGLYLYSLW